MKKILIVSSTFYPDKTVGAIRVSQWAKHLPAFGWQPTIACRFQGVTATDEEIARNIHPDCSINYLDANPGNRNQDSTKSSSAQKNNSLGKFIKHNIVKSLLEPFSIPDVSRWMWRKLEKRLQQIAESEKSDIILTSSPPHSIHSAGLSIARTLNIPLICDFRDPFLDDSRFRPRGIRKLLSHKFVDYEKQLVEQSAHVITAIPGHYDELVARHASHSSKIHLIKNGFPDEMDFQPAGSTPSENEIVITTAGVISSECVDVFKNVFSNLKNDLGNSINLRFHHYGPVPESAINDSQFTFHGKVNHEQVLGALVSSNVLLLFIDKIRSACGGLSSKLYEYLATGHPIVAIRPTAADRQLLDSLDWVLTLDQPCPTQASEFIKKAIRDELSAPQPWLEQYRLENGRKSKAKQLSQILSL